MEALETGPDLSDSSVVAQADPAAVGGCHSEVVWIQGLNLLLWLCSLCGTPGLMGKGLEGKPSWGTTSLNHQL